MALTPKETRHALRELRRQRFDLHQSSGFARLDEQALQAMRSARFQPLVDSGGAYEWLVIAPLQYDID